MTYDFISPILQWLNTNAGYSWLITFIISTSESIAIIGTIVPGSVTMTAIGALAGAGIIPLWSTLLWAFLGAIVGDGISYGVGFFFQKRIRQLWIFRKNPSVLESGEAFFRRYGDMSVFIGRFIGPIRALIPLVAGMMGMKPLRFFIANIASAAGWAPAYMLPGILLGAASLELPPDIATRVVITLLFWTLLFLFFVWLIRKIPLIVHHYIMHFFQTLWECWRKSPRLKWLKRLLQHHHESSTPLQLTLVFYFILTCIIFIALTRYIYTHGSSSIFINQSIYHLFRGIETNDGKNIMIYITLFGQKEVILPVTGIIIVWLLLTKHWHTAFHAIALTGLTVISVLSIKQGIHSLRPWGVFHSTELFSFPGGHSTLTTVFYVSLALLISHALTYKSRKLMYIFVGIIIAAISLSRLYLGVHWFTDIIGAWILSAALLILITISYNRKQAIRPRPTTLLMLTLLSLALICQIVAYKYVPQLQADFTQLDHPIEKTRSDVWWNDQNIHFLPEWRINVLGFPSQFINIEWAGDINAIEKMLKKHHWEIPPEQNWISILFRLSGVQSAEHLSLIPPLYLDKKPVLVVIKNIPAEKKLLVLRLWSSTIYLKDSQHPLWVGVVGLVPRTYGWLSRHYKIDVQATPEVIFNNTPSPLKFKTINMAVPNKNRNNTQSILLVK